MARKRTTKDKATSVEKELKGAVKRLRAQLASAEKSAEKWKTRAKARAKDAAGLKGELTAVRRRLDKAETNATKWKDRAKAQPGEAASVVALAAAPASAATPTLPPGAATDATLTTAPDATPTAAPDATPAAAPTATLDGVPDDSWSVTRLRGEARARGVAGYSRKTKAQLLDDLRGPAD